MDQGALITKMRASLAKCCNALLIFLVAVMLNSCKNREEIVTPEPIKPVKLLTVQAGVKQLGMSLPGRVRAAKRSELSFKVSGPLEKLPIDEGQVVKKGDLIAQILPRDFQTAINEAKARELEAEQQYQRYKELYAKRQVSKSDFDRYRASRDVSRAQLEDANNALKDTTLVAPFDGVIAKRYVENFEKIQVKQPIAYLQLISQLEILIDVPELMMAQFKQSGTVEVFAEFDAAVGSQFPLIVKEFSTDADPATQTYQVVLTMDQPTEANILPGMTSKVTASTGEGYDAGSSILIPAIAVLNDADNQDYIYLFDRDTKTAKKKPVSIGPLEGSKNVLVKEGLKGGEEIIIAGITKLKDGMKVRPWESQREGK
ncbi:MAG: efflux RND transporter periplasmic adaptor subunit [Desulfobulbaceae bacterium]|nr:efflux RND transporter periplasmic adaptor subunit [Desulfobulbaceae bacterium]